MTSVQNKVYLTEHTRYTESRKIGVVEQIDYYYENALQCSIVYTYCRGCGAIIREQIVGLITCLDYECECITSLPYSEHYTVGYNENA